MGQAMDTDPVITNTQRWLERAVIGLNLCPFAKAVHVKQQIHFAVSRAVGHADIREDLVAELHGLVAHDAAVRDTTLLILPDALPDFLDFNDFLGVADRTLAKLKLDGVVQIASFHPAYQFADAAPDDMANCTNRAPYPILHLLREASVARAVAAFPEAESIYEHNIATLQKLGPAGWAALGLTA